jgi:hypothetical protein
VESWNIPVEGGGSCRNGTGGKTGNAMKAA